MQVLDILDLGSSAWSQVEALSRIEAGEEVKGREVVRVVPIMNADDGAGADAPSAGAGMAPAATKRSAGPHKVLLQDARGTKVWGFEVVKIPKVGIGEEGTSIGCKMLLKGCVVRRGVVMLGPECVSVLGGKVEGWDRRWKEGRKTRLTAEAGMGGV